MSVSGISANSYLSQSMQNWQSRTQKMQSEFQQLGQDLQSGNMTQAQSDFNILSQNLPSSLTQNSTLSQAFNSLGSALQTGNASSAQQAYKTLQQDLQQVGQSHHHHHGGEGSQNSATSAGNTLAQLFGTLGAALTGGNLSAAQTAYSTLTKDLAGFGWGSGNSSTSAASALSLVG